MDAQQLASLGIEEIRVPSSLDQSVEPNLLWSPDTDTPRPLLVALHTWSFDRFNQIDDALDVAQRQGWHVLLPEFRGPNLHTNPRAQEACASQLALQDVMDAIDYVCANRAVQEDAIFLMGGSGGGHMALMLAAYRPATWRTVAAFCGITDLEAWHAENPNYSAHIAACCGGEPSESTREAYRARSPLYQAKALAQAEVVIYHGKYDHSVPVTHAMRMYDAVFAEEPAARVFLTIFDGGHDMLWPVAEQQFLTSLHAVDAGSELTS